MATSTCSASIQFQGQVQLEARCNGVKNTFTGSATRSTSTARTGRRSSRTIAAKLKQDPSIDFVVTLGAPDALAAMNAIKDTGSKAKVGTFDFNPQIPAKIKSGELQFAIDQQPYLQGYEAVDSLWLYKNNGNILGGGKPTLTGPFFVDKQQRRLRRQVRGRRHAVVRIGPPPAGGPVGD